MRERILPRLLRGSLIIAVWAGYEAAVRQVAWVRLSELSSQRKFRPRARFMAGARRFFAEALKLPLEDDESRYERLADLETIRNAFAHANGLKDGMRRDEWRQLRRVSARQQTPIAVWQDMFVPSGGFVAKAYEDVAASVRDLVARARVAPRPARAHLQE